MAARVVAIVEHPADQPRAASGDSGGRERLKRRSSGAADDYSATPALRLSRRSGRQCPMAGGGRTRFAVRVGYVLGRGSHPAAIHRLPLVPPGGQRHPATSNKGTVPADPRRDRTHGGVGRPPPALSLLLAAGSALGGTSVESQQLIGCVIGVGSVLRRRLGCEKSSGGKGRPDRSVPGRALSSVVVERRRAHVRRPVRTGHDGRGVDELPLRPPTRRSRPRPPSAPSSE